MEVEIIGKFGVGKKKSIKFLSIIICAETEECCRIVAWIVQIKALLLGRFYEQIHGDVFFYSICY